MRGVKREDRTCSVEGCATAFYAKSFCKQHYYRERRHGDPTAFIVVPSKERINERGDRWCSRHREWLPEKSFSGTGKSWCRECRRVDRYKLSSKQLAALLKQTKGKCSICRTRAADVIDHDHACCSGRRTCGRCVRGLICRQCNAAIGVLTEEGLKRALIHLSKENLVSQRKFLKNIEKQA